MKGSKELSIIFVITIGIISPVWSSILGNIASGGGGGVGYYSSSSSGHHNMNPGAQNLTTSVGKTVYLNCSLHTSAVTSSSHVLDFFEYSLTVTATTTSTTLGPSSILEQLVAFNPTWLKADFVYNQNGAIESHRTENIIVTRKGVVVGEGMRDKAKLIQSPTMGVDRVQTLKLSDIEVKDEGKYICRELSANIDRIFYLNVFCKKKKKFRKN